jgi:hypothetical protein
MALSVQSADFWHSLKPVRHYDVIKRHVLNLNSVFMCFFVSMITDKAGSLVLICDDVKIPSIFFKKVKTG